MAQLYEASQLARRLPLKRLSPVQLDDVLNSRDGRWAFGLVLVVDENQSTEDKVKKVKKVMNLELTVAAFYIAI